MDHEMRLHNGVKCTTKKYEVGVEWSRMIWQSTVGGYQERFLLIFFHQFCLAQQDIDSHLMIAWQNWIIEGKNWKSKKA